MVARTQDIADGLGYRLRIIRVTKTPSKKHFVLFYISENPRRDVVEFFELAREFGKAVGGKSGIKTYKGYRWQVCNILTQTLMWEKGDKYLNQYFKYLR